MPRVALPQKVLHSHELWLCGIESVINSALWKKGWFVAPLQGGSCTTHQLLLLQEQYVKLTCFCI